jgi:hypothetical protein
MKQMKNLLLILLIATILLGQAGCAMIAGQVAMAGGKKVYQKMQEDKAEKAQTEQQ